MVEINYSTNELNIKYLYVPILVFNDEGDIVCIIVNASNKLDEFCHITLSRNVMDFSSHIARGSKIHAKVKKLQRN